MITEFEDATPNPEFLIKSIADNGTPLLFKVSNNKCL